jgi:isochorismate synthase/2-succinyl-5-enolpyruvyl-6-hydroxy-3-cyclohexene-1-carboxylate synthase/2-succinyl-6-hydroxy-2,4-cyclohexadiene-1-carboxylate synthase/O-succinylbenzoate synthase
MCRAHGIAHQRVTDRQSLRCALKAAWALNSHSVVELIVARDSNVQHHRSIQAAVKAAVLRALHNLALEGASAIPLKAV